MIGLLLALAVLWVLLTAVWAAVWPLFVERGAPRSEAEIEGQELEAEKARLLGEIHELELDYQTGKLSDEDHGAIRTRLKERAVEVMRRIDALSPNTELPQRPRGAEQGVSSDPL